MNPTETLLRRLAAACMYGQDNPAFDLSAGTRAEIRAAAQAARAHIDRLDFDAKAPLYKTAYSAVDGYVGILEAKKIGQCWIFECRTIDLVRKTLTQHELTNFAI